jgi:curved DNA-binding protein CbpA
MDTIKEDPAAILGVSPDAGEEELRAAYLREVRRSPPDQDPARFEAVRDAYELLRDPIHRARLVLREIRTSDPLGQLLEEVPGELVFLGPEAWKKALQK